MQRDFGAARSSTEVGDPAIVGLEANDQPNAINPSRRQQFIEKEVASIGLDATAEKMYGGSGIRPHSQHQADPGFKT